MPLLLYCATKNRGKLAEFRHAAATLDGDFEIEVLHGLDQLQAPDEDGETFEANAEEKALYYSCHASGLVFADDSGLEVDALGGAPGVYSARYAGIDAGAAANNRLLLERLAGVTDRRARFVCAIALAQNGRLLGTFRGLVEGHILTEPRGAGGFGYDPLFECPAFGCTFAEATAAQKLEVSHRGEALRAMLRHLSAR